MELILDGLNEAQLAAVTSPANVLQILAPPGSGKTKTLTSRVAYLIRHHNYKPWNILCLTFTIKSSREMKERLAKLIGNGMEAKLVLGTFHSVCRRYLVSYGHLIGIRKGFGIVDSSDSLSIIKRIIKRLRLNIDPKVAQSRISSTKSKGTGYLELPKEASKKKNIDQQEFLQVFEAYEDQLDQANLLDYDDLLLRCSDLLRQQPDCVSNVEAVLIDEFQDTNLVQFDLMRLFAAKQKRVTTVGDPDQSIYGWRSAEIKNLDRMKTQYPETLVIHLEDNYRSSGAILLAAQELIEQDESRPSKALSPTHCPGTLPVLRRLPSSDIEALWIVSEIKRTVAMTGCMLTHQDFAILLRSAALSRQIESAMGRAGIPYRMVGGQRFFDRVEVKILLDYLRVVSQPSNNGALARVINVPPRSLGPSTVKALLEEAESKKLTLWSLIRDAAQGNIKTSTKITKPAGQGLGAFIQIILTAQQKLKNLTDPLTPPSLLHYIIKKLKFQEYLKKTYEIDHEGRWANVEELISQATDYQIPHVVEGVDPGTRSDTDLPAIEGITQSKDDAGEELLSMFLANVALAIELQKDKETEDDQSQSRAQVTISTIHAAKGLEWPVVFVPAVYEGSIPHSRAEDTDEERRLLYVAMTRAQALLYISCPVKNSQREESVLSQFLDPKSVGHYLVNAGPRLDSGVVSDIARILRRPYPSASKIIEESVTIQHKEDDLWPLDGQEHPEEMKSRLDNGSAHTGPDSIGQSSRRSQQDFAAGEQYSVRCRTTNGVGSTIDIGYATTMGGSQSFSVNSFSGFMSATSQLHRLEKEQKIMTTEQPLTRQKCEAEMTSRKRKAQDRTQSNLTSLWGLKTQAAELEVSSEASHTKRLALSDSNSLRPRPHGIEPPSRAPLMAVPENLAKNGLGPVANFARPKPSIVQQEQPDERYVFLSSSPPHPEVLGDASRAVDVGSLDTVEAADAVGRFDKHTSRLNDVLPAVAVQQTSMAQLQAASASRKTLGVRRSMNGWSARGAQVFSVPKKVER
ncbi:MAG: hypothetical protein Q9181_003562 [Wetmoreana brouardii]